MGADPGSLSRSFAGTGGRTYGLFPLFRLPGSPWFRRSGYGEDLPRHRRADRGLSPFLSAAGRSTAALRKGDGGDLLRHCREMCAAHQKKRGSLGRTRPPSRPGTPPPHDEKRQNVFCIRDRLSLYLSPSFLSTDRATKSVSVPEKASAADPFSARRETMHTADVVLFFPDGFNLPKVGF